MSFSLTLLLLADIKIDIFCKEYLKLFSTLHLIKQNVKTLQYLYFTYSIYNQSILSSMLLYQEPRHIRIININLLI